MFNYPSLCLTALNNLSMPLDIVLHGQSVSIIAFNIAKRLNCSETFIHDLHVACSLHDIGKIGVDPLILNKPSKLTSSEYEEIRKHALIGSQILASYRNFKKYEKVIRYHHEKVDGSGYFGIKGTDIPLISKILVVSDIYDSLRSDRIYRKAYSFQKAYRIMEDEKSLYDSNVYDAFLFAIESKEVIRLYHDGLIPEKSVS